MPPCLPCCMVEESLISRVYFSGVNATLVASYAFVRACVLYQCHVTLMVRFACHNENGYLQLSLLLVLLVFIWDEEFLSPPWPTPFPFDFELAPDEF